MISVVIPVYNAADTLDEQLAALAEQSYAGAWEVVVADNGSTDDSAKVAEAWRDRLPELRVVDASARRGAAAARNIGAAAARGDRLAFCDADDAVAPRWLEALDHALDEHDFVTGAIDHLSLNPGFIETWHVDSHVHEVPRGLRFKPYALTGNMAVSRRAFDAVGGFAEDLRSVGEDVDVSWRLQLGGYPLHFEPGAVLAVRHRRSLVDVWRQHVAYGFADAVLYRRFRERGVPRLGAGPVLAAYLRLVLGLPRLLRASTRGAWVRDAAKRWGRLRGSLRERVLYL